MGWFRRKHPHEFQIYPRLGYNVGDRVVFNVIRDGKHLELPMTLPDNPAD
jgi:S1-C subfamily serine protease